MNNKSFLGLFLAVLVFLPGCVHVPRYTRQSLAVAGDDCSYRATQKHINVEIKKCSNADVYYLFGDRSNMLMNKEINVVYISVNNLNDNTYIITPVDINMEQVPYTQIVKSMKKTNSAARFAGGAASVAVGAGMAKVICNLPLFAAGVAPLLIVPVAWGTFIAGTVGIVTGIKSVVMNRRISKDLKEKILHEKITINPGDSYEGLVFVKAVDYTPKFTVVMHEEDNAKSTVTFDVDLQQN